MRASEKRPTENVKKVSGFGRDQLRHESVGVPDPVKQNGGIIVADV